MWNFFRKIFFKTKKEKEIIALYTEFNRIQNSNLNVLNNSNPENSKCVGGLYDMTKKTSQFFDFESSKLTKLNKERIAKIYELSSEISDLSDAMKLDLNTFFETKYPEEMKTLYK